MARIKGQPSLTAAEKAQIAERYAAGETMRGLRFEYHRTRLTIKNAILAAGYDIRPPGYGKGREWTAEWRAAHYAATQTAEFAEKSRQTLLQRLPGMRGPAVNSPIERRLHDALRKVGVGFTTQSLLLERYLVDVEIHQARIVLEADGAQHSLRDQREADTKRDADLAAAGYRVFRFTGSEINTDASLCVQEVITSCGLQADEEPVYDIRTRFAGPGHPLWKGGEAEFTCDNPACGKTFFCQPALRRSKRTFCNHACYAATLRGTSRSR